MAVKSWIENMKRELAGRVGEEKASHVLQGSNGISGDTPSAVLGEWFAGFPRRLDALGEPANVKGALQACSCVFDGGTVERIHEIFNASDNISAFAGELIRQKVFGKSIVFKDGVIFITKKYASECGIVHPEENRCSKVCHCPLGHTAPKPVSMTFCNCCGGFYKKMFDGLWNADTMVEPVATRIAGDGACVFAVHVPEHVLAAKQYHHKV